MINDSLLEHIRKNRLIIYGGCDFNIEHMFSQLAIYENGKLYVFKEYANFLDTPQLIEAIRSDFPDNKIIMHPDASGIKRGSADAGVSDISLLRKAGFSIRARSRNPFVRDRIASVNNAFNHKKLFIDTERCPETTECLEQQIYLPNGQPDKTSGLDHAMDSLGYLIHYVMPVRELKPKVKGVIH